MSVFRTDEHYRCIPVGQQNGRNANKNCIKYVVNTGMYDNVL